MDITLLKEKAEELRILGIIITQDQQQIIRELWDEPCRRNIYSASKSFTSTAVGIAVKEGLIDLNEKVIDAFKEDIDFPINEHLAKVTVRDLLTMSLGQEKSFLMGAYRPYYKEWNWAKLGLSQPFVCDPGEQFVYNNVGPYLAGLLVQRRAGCNLVDYLYPRLFKPLGMTKPTWEADPLGNTFGAGGLFLTIDELHQFGLLYLNKGKYNGKQIISEEWIKEATSKQVDNGEDGYGYLFWRGKYNTYRADGKYEQYTIICPDKNAVITISAESKKSRAILNFIYDSIYPQL